MGISDRRGVYKLARVVSGVQPDANGSILFHSAKRTPLHNVPAKVHLGRETVQLAANDFLCPDLFWNNEALAVFACRNFPITGATHDVFPDRTR